MTLNTKNDGYSQDRYILRTERNSCGYSDDHRIVKLSPGCLTPITWRTAKYYSYNSSADNCKKGESKLRGSAPRQFPNP